MLSGVFHVRAVSQTSTSGLCLSVSFVPFLPILLDVVLSLPQLPFGYSVNGVLSNATAVRRADLPPSLT